MRTSNLMTLTLYQRSSLYGASLVASEFDDSNIVVWGPRGCTSQILEAMNIQRQQFDYYHFAVTESDILTNGYYTLRNNLLPMVEGCINKGPLFFFLGDATQLTSEDVEGFINSNISPDFPIIYVETGFKGDSYYGINETIFKIVKRLCKTSKPKNPKLINIIPEVGISPQWRGDAEEIARILSSLGFEVNIIPNRSSIADISEVAAASLTILLNPSIGRKAAGHIEEKFGIPVFTTSNMPIGFLGTELWLKELNSYLGNSISDIEKVLDEEKEYFFTRMRPGLREENYNLKVNKIRLSNFIICDEAGRAENWNRLLLKEFNFKGGCIFKTVSSEVTEENESNDIGLEKVRLLDDIGALTDYINKEDTLLILASDWICELPEIGRMDKLVVINNPVIKKITLISKPYLGFRGMLYFLEDVLNSIEY